MTNPDDKVLTFYTSFVPKVGGDGQGLEPLINHPNAVIARLNDRSDESVDAAHLILLDGSHIIRWTGRRANGFWYPMGSALMATDHTAEFLRIEAEKEVWKHQKKSILRMADTIEARIKSQNSATVCMAPKKFPEEPLKKTVFLAGSIDMGTAEQWQSRAVDGLSDRPLVILNPRRDDFDADLPQTIENPIFKEQVNWELDGIERSDYIFFYFDPNGKAPVTMLELGKSSEIVQSQVVVCPKGFWRRGNIEIVCDRNNIPLFNTFEEGLDHLKEIIDEDTHE